LGGAVSIFFRASSALRSASSLVWTNFGFFLCLFEDLDDLEDFDDFEELLEEVAFVDVDLEDDDLEEDVEPLDDELFEDGVVLLDVEVLDVELLEDDGFEDDEELLEEVPLVVVVLEADWSFLAAWTGEKDASRLNDRATAAARRSMYVRRMMESTAISGGFSRLRTDSSFSDRMGQGGRGSLIMKKCSSYGRLRLTDRAKSGCSSRHFHVLQGLAAYRARLA